MKNLTTKEKAQQARKASLNLSTLSNEQRNKALKNIAQALTDRKEEIFKANQNDLERSKEENLEEPLLKRLKFDENKLNDVVNGINDLAQMPDCLNRVDLKRELAPGLVLKRVSTPLGVLGIVFESRPDAFVQISSLAVKSGNAAILKGGREALETNRILKEIIHSAGVEAGLPEGFIENLESRDDVNEMLSLSDDIDLIIPRGSNAFVKYIMDNTSIPVMGHADGICHTYIDKDADLEKAVKIAVDGKTQYPAVCNATETLLVHKDILKDFLPVFNKALIDTHPVKILGDEESLKFIEGEPATEEDWKSEYLDYVLSIKAVDSPEEAINHINTYGSGHTDSIVSENEETLELFRDGVDSACVLTNCSTRFSDGFRFGFGAEVGISTSKIHARGPVGVDGLTSYKYILDGDGDIVRDFAEGKREFTHKDL